MTDVDPREHATAGTRPGTSPESSARTVVLRLPTTRLLLVALLSVPAALSLLSVAAFTAFAAQPIAGSETLRAVLDVNEETSLSTWWTTCLAFVAALTAAGLAASASHRETAAGWGVIGVGILAVSADEVLTVHEAAGERLRMLVGADAAGNNVYALPAVLIVLVVGVIVLRLLSGLAPHVRRGMVGGVVIYLTGAAGVELLAGLTTEVDEVSWTATLLQAVEEALETVGITMLLVTMLTVLVKDTGSRNSHP